MLNWFIAYCFPMSFLLCIVHHGRIVGPVRQNGQWVRLALALGSIVVRLWIQGFFMLMAVFRAGLMNPLGPGYSRWWEDYTSEHSALVWLLVVVPLTVALWGLKTFMFSVAKRPGFSDDPNRPLPNLHKINMRTPLLWNTVFWVWLLCNPLMPFWRCWVQVWLRE